MGETPQEVIRVSRSHVDDDADVSSRPASERFRVRAADPERTPHAESDEHPANADHDRLVASARIQVKADRSLGRKTDPRIVELSGL